MNRVFDTHVHCLSINLITTLKVFHLQLFTMYIQSFDFNGIPFPSIPQCYIWRQKESKQLPWRTWENCHILEILLVGGGRGRGRGLKFPYWDHPLWSLCLAHLLFHWMTSSWFPEFLWLVPRSCSLVWDKVQSLAENPVTKGRFKL